MTSGGWLTFVADRLRRAAPRRAAGRSEASPSAPRVLYVTSTSGGGTPLTSRDLIRGVQGRFDAFWLRCNGERMSLAHCSGDRERIVETHRLSRPVDPVRHRSEEYDRVVAGWISTYSIDILHVRHLAWHSLGLIDAARSLSVPVVLSFHDFYSVCPTVKLLDDRQSFCGGVCSPGAGTCVPDLWPLASMPPLKHGWVREWQAMFDTALGACDRFVTTSPMARDIILRTFPSLAGKPFDVIPHGRDFQRMRQLAVPPAADEGLRVLVPGNISVAKGAAVIRAVKTADRADRIAFHMMGDVDQSLKKAPVTLHGRYKRDDFSRIAGAIRPHVGAIFSIWPETYSHTLTELWANGIPVVGLDIGAIGERIREHGGGWLFSVHASAEELLGGLLAIAADRPGYQARLSEVRAWQQGRGAALSERAMADRYCDLYRDVVAARRPLPPPFAHGEPGGDRPDRP